MRARRPGAQDGVLVRAPAREVVGLGRHWAAGGIHQDAANLSIGMPPWAVPYGGNMGEAPSLSPRRLRRPVRNTFGFPPEGTLPSGLGIRSNH